MEQNFRYSGYRDLFRAIAEVGFPLFWAKGIIASEIREIKEVAVPLSLCFLCFPGHRGTITSVDKDEI